MNSIMRIIMLMILFFFSTSPSLFANEMKRDTSMNIVVTTFPIYDYLREIIGSTPTKFTLSLIIDNGIDLHNYQPSTEDIATISNADVFIYNGGESDVWVKKILSQAMNKQMKTVHLMELLGDHVKKEKIVEGMEKHDHIGHDHTAHKHSGEHDHRHHNHDEHDHREHVHDMHIHEKDAHDTDIFDEHIWLSLKNTIILSEKLSSLLQALDSQNAIYYAQNTDKYIQQLQNLDMSYQEKLSNAKRKTVLVADRFPLRYFLDDYGISYYAAFPGCSAETEASFATVIFLSNKINELNLERILIIDNSSNNIAQAVIQSSNNKHADVLSLNSLQTVTTKQLSEGITYLSVMKKNLETLEKALH